MTFHEMHYFKQQRQSEGWKGDFFVFEKKKFFNEFYIPNKNNIPNNFQDGFEYFKSSLPEYIINRNTQKIFQTKFMDITTEDSIDYELTTDEIAKKAKLSKTTRIENKFEKFLKNKADNQNPELLKYPSFQPKDLNLDDVIAYFALQCSRTPLNLFGWFDDFIKEFPVKYTKEYALEFRKFYNKQYLNFFSEKYKYLINNRNNILFVPMEIVSTNPNLKSLVSVSEHNTINLLQYKRLSPFLKKYPDELLINIDMTVVSSNLMYFCIIVPPIGKKNNIMYIKNLIKKYNEFPWTLWEHPRELSFYEGLLKEIQETWNNFSLFSSHEYLICSKQEEALNFMAEQLYYFHRNDELEGQYRVNDHIDDLLSLEKLLK